MLWKSDKRTFVVILADMLSVFFSFIIYFNYNSFGEIRIFNSYIILHSSHYYIISLFVSLIFVVILDYLKAYSNQRFTSLLQEYSVVIKTSLIVFIIMIIVSYGFNYSSTKVNIILFLFIFILIILIQKTILFYIAREIRKRGHDIRKIIIIGDYNIISEFIEKIENNLGWGLKIVGLIALKNDSLVSTQYPILGTIKEFKNIIKNNQHDEIVFAISYKSNEMIIDALEICNELGIQVRIVSNFFNLSNIKIDTDFIYGLNIISLKSFSLDSYYLLFKRFFDLILSSILIILLTPVFIIIMIIIRLTSKGPIIYKRKCIGKNYIPFNMLKFRTMIIGADEQLKNNTTIFYKNSNDNRITSIGKVLRKFSLDELPQLLNVFIGNMSLVGPRPNSVEEYHLMDLYQRKRLLVKPGITGLWQVSGRNDLNNFDDVLRFDLHYINNCSFFYDLSLLIRTIPIVITGKGTS